MNVKQLLSTLVLFLFISGYGTAQNFLIPTEGFSMKKTAYVTLMDGTEMTGQFKGGVVVNGIYKTVSLKDEEGKKHKWKPEEVKSMLLPVSKISEIGKSTKNINNATKWEDDSSLNEAALEEGYVLFESVVLKKKKKEQTVLLQLLNPAYSESVKVYHNAMSGETGGLSVGGIKVTGGDARTYYVKKGEGMAMKFGKPKYKENYVELFGDCSTFAEKYGEDIKWSDFEEHVYFYATECKE